MKNIFSILLALFAVGFQIQAFATDVCVPTMTVEQAQNQMDTRLAAIAQDTKQSYAVANSIYDQANAKSLTDHQERTKKIEARYQEEVEVIKANLDTGWREKMAAAIEAHNQAGMQSAIQYTAETEAHLASYNETVAQAKVAYNTKAAEIIAQYNTAVCAGK
ncbi:MAG: hypothetical protein ACXWC9_06710 [Pseudobdellovibrionaceae bacterium]